MEIIDPKNPDARDMGYRPSEPDLETINLKRVNARYIDDAWAEAYYADVTTLLRECEERQNYYENERKRRQSRDYLEEVVQQCHGAMTLAGVPDIGELELSLLERVKWLIARMIPADDRYDDE